MHIYKNGTVGNKDGTQVSEGGAGTNKIDFGTIPQNGESAVQILTIRALDGKKTPTPPTLPANPIFTYSLDGVTWSGYNTALTLDTYVRDVNKKIYIKCKPNTGDTLNTPISTSVSFTYDNLVDIPTLSSPSITASSPSYNTVTINLTSATSNVGATIVYDVFIGGVQKDTGIASFASKNYTNIPAGTPDIYVVARDTVNSLSQTSNHVTNVTVADQPSNQAPSFTAQPTFSSIAQTSATVSYSATDDVGVTTHEISKDNGATYTTITPSGTAPNFTYNLTGLTQATTYQVIVRVGDVSAAKTTSNVVTLTTVTNQAPSFSVQPSVYGTPGQTSVALQYTATDDTAITSHGYKLNGGATLTNGTLTDLGSGQYRLTIPGLTQSTTYNIQIVLGDGSLTTTSNSVSVTTSTNTAPTATNVNITGTDTIGSVLTGNYTYDDTETDPQGTSTFRWLRNGVAIVGATAQTYTIVEADIGTTLTFEVTPVAQTGTITGTPVTATKAIPVPVPTEVSATGGNGQNTVSFTNNAALTTETYNLYWGTVPGVTKSNGTKITGVTSPYTHLGLTNGQTYYYVVTMVVNGVESAESAEFSTIPFTLYNKTGLVFDINAAKAYGNAPNTNGGTNKTIWQDISGNGLNATLTNFGFTSSPADGWVGAGTDADPYRCAVYNPTIDATSNGIYVTRGAAIEPTAGITLEWWGKLGKTVAQFESSALMLMQKYVYADNKGYGLYIDKATNALTFRLYANGAWRDASYTITWHSDTTNYYHITATFDGRYMKIYEGTVLKTTLDLGATYTIVQHNTLNLFLMCYGSNTTPTGLNVWAEVPLMRIYNRALSALEVGNNYANKWAS